MFFILCWKICLRTVKYIVAHYYEGYSKSTRKIVRCCIFQLLRNIYLKWVYKVALPWVQMFLEIFTCKAITDFELQCVNKTPPPNLNEKEHREGPAKFWSKLFDVFWGNYKHLNRVSYNTTDTEIVHKCT